MGVHVFRWLPALLIAVSSTILIPILAMQPSAGGTVVAGVFPPWWTSRDVLAAAGRAGSIVRAGSLPFIVVVASDMPDRLVASGALFTLDPVGPAGCLTR